MAKVYEVMADMHLERSKHLSEYRFSHFDTRSGYTVFLNEDNLPEYYVKRDYVSGWHLLYKGDAYEFCSSSLSPSSIKK